MSNRRPQNGEYWQIEQGIGINAQYGKILAQTREAVVPESFLVYCIKNDTLSPVGFTQRVHIIDRTHLIDIFPIDNLMTANRIRDKIINTLRDAALTAFKERLEAALSEL